MKEKSLILNCAQEDIVPQVAPVSSLLSSYKAQWNGIRFEFHRQPPAETPEYSLPQHIVTILTQGIKWLEKVTDGKAQSGSFNAGDITITPLGCPRQYRWAQEIEVIHMILEPTLISRVAYESVAPSSVELLPHLIQSDPLVNQIGLALKRQLEGNCFGSSLYAESAAAFLGVHLLQHYSARKPVIREYQGGLPQNKLRAAIDYIQAHLADDISLEAMADYLGISRYHFCRMFKQSTGLSPHQYLIQCRVERAKQLLKQGKMGISDVAITCGFTHQSHLHRHFKRLTGVTPRTFIKS